VPDGNLIFISSVVSNSPLVPTLNIIVYEALTAAEEGLTDKERISR